MEKNKLKPLIKLIIEELQKNYHPLKLVDNWHQIDTVKKGRMAGTRGYFIMKNGKLADASFEMEGSTGLGGGVDHYGFTLALDNRKFFGIPDNLDEDEDYSEIWKYIENSIQARVITMVKTSNTHKPNITIQFFSGSNHISPLSALRTVQSWVGRQIPDVPENSEVSVDLYGDIYLKANSIREFLLARNPRDLKYYG